MPENRITRHRPAIRTVLGALGLVQLVDGLYALLAPHAFYSTSRSAAAGWPRCRPTTSTWSATSAASSSPPGSCWWPRPGSASGGWSIIACASYLLFAVPHAIYHLSQPRAVLDRRRDRQRARRLAATVVLPLWVLFELRRRPAIRPPPSAARPRRTATPGSRGCRRRRAARSCGCAFRESRRRYGEVARPAAGLRPPPEGDGRLRGAGARRRSARTWSTSGSSTWPRSGRR